MKGMRSRPRRGLTHHRYGTENLTPPSAHSVTAKSKLQLVRTQLAIAWPCRMPRPQERFRWDISLPLSQHPSQWSSLQALVPFHTQKPFSLHFDSKKPPMFMPVLLKLQYSGLIHLTQGEWIHLSYFPGLPSVPGPSVERGSTAAPPC